MRTLIVLFIFSIHPLLTWGQVGPAITIDSTFETAGVTQFVVSDIDNDGNNEVIASFTGSLGKIAFYKNQSAGQFSVMNNIDSLPFSKGVAVGDFNGDNWPDLVSIGSTQMEARVYFNNLGTFSGSIKLDSLISIQVNDVVVADFDTNNTDDIVIIGQHSIDLYRNNGAGAFTKEIILSTSTSPLSLECLDLATADVDNDGDIDLICGETEGLVIYINNGNAQFSPQYYSAITEIIFLVHPVDIDGDGDHDVIAKNNSGDVKWFRNNGAGVMTFESTLTTIPNIISLSSVDYNNDGLEDIYVSYINNISIFKNDTNHTFSSEVNIYQDNGLLMGPVQMGNLDNLGGLDYLWSGGNNRIAYHINQASLAINTQTKSQSNLFYPNPTSGLLISKKTTATVTVFNAAGKKLERIENSNKINLTPYPSGIYYLLITNDEGLEVQKIIKE